MEPRERGGPLAKFWDDPGTITQLETVGRETLDLEESRAILDMVEKHREQLTACQRQFRLANVKVSLF